LAERRGGGEGVVEDFQGALEEGDGEARLGLVEAAGQCAEGSGELCAEGHAVAEEIGEIVVIALGKLAEGFEFIHERVERVLGPLLDGMDEPLLVVASPVDALAGGIG
jgi:hypothetical protein